MIKTNFHTHSKYCDGKDTPEEMINEAISRGFLAIGFSGHSYSKLDEAFAMAQENAALYRREINHLKEVYNKTIKIYCGIEQDYYSNMPITGYDYVIGSVHNVLKDGAQIVVDDSPEGLKENLQKYYDGNFDDFAEDYFKLVADVVQKTSADIFGHFDLLLKNSDYLGYKPTVRFLDCAEKAVKELCRYSAPFEINTGAMARGYRSVPYPIPEILAMIKKYGGKITFSSDCHDKKYLEYGYDVAEKLALNAGFTEHGVITEKGVEFIPIL